MRSSHIVAVLVAVTLAACAQPEPVATAQPDPDVAVAPTVLEDEPSPVAGGAVASPSPSPSAAATDSPSPVASPTPAVAPSSTPAPTTPTSDESSDPAPASSSEPQGSATIDPVVLLGLTDVRGDHGLEGPAWVDLVSFELVDHGNELAVTLRFDGELPTPPPEGEVPLVGVDVLEGEEGESAYQLFVEGGGQEWGAHLQTPQGFVPFPGTFTLGGRAMTLTVPWNELGSPTRGPVRAYVEWSRESLLINPHSRDTLDGQPHTFDRNP